jgi:ureidoacrylate peracid hydrolase
MTTPSSSSSLSEAFVASGTYRRDGLSVYGPVEPKRTALLVMNMQNAWLAKGAPFEPFGEASTLTILSTVNRLAASIREGGGQVVWLRTTTGAPGAADYWATYFDNFVGPSKRTSAIEALIEGSHWHQLSPLVQQDPSDWVLNKRRFSAFVRNEYDLEERLRARGLDTVVVAGTATNICCESSIRDAMMRDFRTYMPHDAVSAPRPDGHAAGLRSVMQSFADIRSVDEILSGS